MDLYDYRTLSVATYELLKEEQEMEYYAKIVTVLKMQKNEVTITGLL